MNSAMKKLRLEKVTYANYDEILKLCVSEEQAEFVADNEFSLVDAYLTIADERHVFPFGIYNGDEPVGFIMLSYDYVDDIEETPAVSHGNYLLWRFMIDKDQQQKGYGREAIKLALDFMRTSPCGKADYCWLSYEPENRVASALYRSVGFVENGEKCGDEIVAVIKL